MELYIKESDKKKVLISKDKIIIDTNNYFYSTKYQTKEFVDTTSNIISTPTVDYGEYAASSDYTANSVPIEFPIFPLVSLIN